MSVKGSGNALAPSFSTSDIDTISDLVNVVKAKDKNYNPKSINPVLLNSEFYRLKDKRAQVEWLKKRGYDGWYAEMDSKGWGDIAPVITQNDVLVAIYDDIAPTTLKEIESDKAELTESILNKDVMPDEDATADLIENGDKYHRK